MEDAREGGNPAKVGTGGSFGERVAAAVHEKQSFLVVGIDPRWEWLPQPVLDASRRLYGDSWEGVANALLRFGRAIIEAVAPYAVAVKPQIAFYEQYGWWGLEAYAQTVAYAREQGLLVIGDVKRGDIASTAEAYAQAHLGDVPFWSKGGGDEQAQPRGRRRASLLAVDAVTVNPYLGVDGVLPFIEQAVAHRRGLFVLVRTSNPSARQLQDLHVVEPPAAAAERLRRRPAQERTVWQEVAGWVAEWAEAARQRAGYDQWSPVGAVVGGTYPQDLAWTREQLPHSWILVPGYGAQGATAADVAQACFGATRRPSPGKSGKGQTDAVGLRAVADTDTATGAPGTARGGADGPDLAEPLGVLVNASRSVIYAFRQEQWMSPYKPSLWMRACADAAKAARDELWQAALAQTKPGESADMQHE
ncbi:MAG: orotidine-5'-phosphate decarboxylase [Limnochordaceae bacterium]|nr:orotidine-5'-phosphate decarboxylase [Limnochordaceae bacterium]